jgi:hypothetical protein
MDQFRLSRLSNFLVSTFEKEEIQRQTKDGINVNRVVSELATWYEKLRTAMDYREKEVARRAAIERILKRRLTFGGDGQKIAAPLIRELLWARYFPESSITEEEVENTAKTIDLYLTFREQLVEKKYSNINIDEIVYELLSSRIEIMLNKNRDIEIISNFIFHILKDHITIADDRIETRDIQVFIAVRRTFAKYDRPFLYYHLFEQYFGQFNEHNISRIVSIFKEGHQEITKQLNYKLKDRITSYVKKQMPAFLIFGDTLQRERGSIRGLIEDAKRFQDMVFKTAEARYKEISAKVRRAIIRAFIFILLTKFVFAFTIEATYDNLFLGKIMWSAILINILVPPFLMVIASLFIRTPGRDNTKRIYERILNILSYDRPALDRPLALSLIPVRRHPTLHLIFTFLWWAAFILSFGFVIFILNRLDFSIASIGVFVVFLAMIAFFTYRISQTARSYTVEVKPGFTAPIVDFFFMPIVRVGRHLAEGLSQLNILIYIFDYLIETPFKEIFGFLEQWFFFLQTKREELG